MWCKLIGWLQPALRASTLLLAGTFKLSLRKSPRPLALAIKRWAPMTSSQSHCCMIRFVVIAKHHTLSACVVR